MKVYNINTGDVICKVTANHSMTITEALELCGIEYAKTEDDYISGDKVDVSELEMSSKFDEVSDSDLPELLDLIERQKGLQEWDYDILERICELTGNKELFNETEDIDKIGVKLDAKFDLI